MTRAFAIALLAPAVLASSSHAFDLQGHRGARGLVPENTLAAFEAALSVGVSTLELDLGMTRDGVPGRITTMRVSIRTWTRDRTANFSRRPGLRSIP